MCTLLLKKARGIFSAYRAEIIADEYADDELSLRFENEKLHLNDRIESQSSHSHPSPLWAVSQNLKNEIKQFRTEVDTGAGLLL